MGVVEVFICHCHERASAYWLDGECELWNNQQRKKIALSRRETEGSDTENCVIMEELMGK